MAGSTISPHSRLMTQAGTTLVIRNLKAGEVTNLGLEVVHCGGSDKKSSVGG